MRSSGHDIDVILLTNLGEIPILTLFSHVCLRETKILATSTDLCHCFQFRTAEYLLPLSRDTFIIDSNYLFFNIDVI